MESAPGETVEMSFGSTELSRGRRSTYHQREAQITDCAVLDAAGRKGFGIATS